jgi:hypothetical protein
MDDTFRPDPAQKGSYYRRIEDIGRALDALGAAQLPAVPQFVAYYFGSEKLAFGIVGISKVESARLAYHYRRPTLRLDDVVTAAARLSLRVDELDLVWLFASHGEQSRLPTALESPPTKSARVLRNTLTHDFGPTNVAVISAHTAHIPRMQRFLGTSGQVLAYLRKHYS